MQVYLIDALTLIPIFDDQDDIFFIANHGFWGIPEVEGTLHLKWI